MGKRTSSTPIRFLSLFVLTYFLFLTSYFLFSPVISSPSPPSRSDSEVLKDRREAVKEAFEFGFDQYRKYAWGHDELQPVTRDWRDWLQLGATIVDSLDTAYIMGAKKEYQWGREWIEKSLRFDNNGYISVFETTIRILGGLCSLHSLTGDQLYLDKALLLATKLLPAFNSTTGIPYMDINLQDGDANSNRLNGFSSLAAVGSLQMEFIYVAVHTKNQLFFDKVYKVWQHVNSSLSDFPDGLPPLLVSPDTGVFTTYSYTLGPRADSFYEYLLKTYLLTKKQLKLPYQLFNTFLPIFIKSFTRQSKPDQLLYFVTKSNGIVDQGWSELECFTGGLLTLASTQNPSPNDVPQSRSSQKKKSNLKYTSLYGQAGRNLTVTCDQIRKRQPTGISPEQVSFDVSRGGQDFYNVIPNYILRPETVESYFYQWRITSDEYFRETAWDAFVSISKYCKTDDGWSGIFDVTNVNSPYDNLQQSFFLAETLKYIYLTFTDNSVVPLDEYIFNTEAHPIKTFDIPSGWLNPKLY